MAYVAISGELIDSVRSGIQAMARKELATIGEVPKLKGTESFVEAALWGKYAHLKPQMPQEWTRPCGAIVLRIQLPEGAWQETILFITPAAAPPNYTAYSTPKVTLNYDDESIKEILDVITNRRDAQKRWSEVEEHVLKFLQKCKSLNEGLKLWPDLRMYIPKHFLDRVERKVERTKETSTAALDALKNMDTDKIVAAAVIARMSTDTKDET